MVESYDGPENVPHIMTAGDGQNDGAKRAVRSLVDRVSSWISEWTGLEGASVVAYIVGAIALSAVLAIWSMLGGDG